jgi:hypothetical protein
LKLTLTKNLCVALTALGLGGCAAVNGYLGDQNIQPGKFQYLRCNDIAERLKSNENRRIELHALMERAATGTGGTLVNLSVYRPELDQVDAERNMLRRAAGEKKCAAEVPPFQ